HAGPRGNQHHERDQVLCAGRNISVLVILPNLPDILFRRRQDLSKLLYRKRSGFCPVPIGAVKQMTRSTKERMELPAKARFALRRKQAQIEYTVAAVFRRSRRRATSQTAYSFNMSALRSLAPSTSGMLLALLSRNAQKILSTHAIARTVFRRGPVW